VPGENFITPEWDSNSQLSFDHDPHWNWLNRSRKYYNDSESPMKYSFLDLI
jgi:hypothetical protein